MTMRDVRPPDLEMRVRTLSESGRTRLAYTLHSPTGAVPFSHREIAGPVFQGSPEEFQRRLLHKIEQLGHRQDVDGSGLLRLELDRKLKGLGRELWRELFPAEIRQAYREIHRRVRSWMIVSDEPWIPWELIKPYDDSRPDDVLDDDFLALRFELTRWLAGDKTPAHHIAVRSLAIFRTAEDLPHSEREKEVLMKIIRSRPPLRDATPRGGSADRFLDFLESGDADLLHVIGHGTHSASQADESGIPFPDRSVLRPVDLEGPLATRIGRIRPLVFQNSCWAGQQGWSLTLLGGWAPRWVSVCGCGAFVAPMWPSRDKAALAFARAFYTALERGAALGQAALEARRQVAHERPGDPSALAYTVYGHAHARVWFGEAPPEVEALPGFPDPIPFVIEPEKQPGSASRSPRVWIAVAAVLIVALALMSDGFPTLSGPVTSQNMAFSPLAKPGPAEPPKEPAAEQVPATHPKPTQETSRGGSAPVVEKLSPKGIAFRVTGGSSLVNYALKQALQTAAKPLAEEGISGWIITLKLEQPGMTSHDESGIPLVACRLTAEAGAQGTGPAIDLGPVSSVNSQTDGSQACEAATGLLAEAVLSRFVKALGTKGES
jgi:CHAT domain